MTYESEHEFISRVLLGNEAAIQLANMLFRVSQVWDDLIDRDVPVPDDAINRMMWMLLIDIPINPFYHDNFAHLLPAMRGVIRDWLDANEIERDARNNPHDAGFDLRISYILRDSVATLLCEMAYLIGGYDWMRQVSPEVRRWVHDEDYTEYCRSIDGGNR
jgi:hypothetical protein